MLMNLTDLFNAYQTVNLHDPEIIEVEQKYIHEFPDKLQVVLGAYLSEYAEFYFKAGFRQAVKLLENE